MKLHHLIIKTYCLLLTTAVMAMETMVPAKELSKKPTMKSLFALCLPKVPPTKLYELLKGDLVITEPEYKPYKNISTWPDEYLLKHKEDLCELITYLKNDAENKESQTEYGQIMDKITFKMQNGEGAGMLLAYHYQESQSDPEKKDIFPAFQFWQKLSTGLNKQTTTLFRSFLRNAITATTVQNFMLNSLKEAWYREGTINPHLSGIWISGPCCSSKILPQNEATLTAFLKGLYLEDAVKCAYAIEACKDKNASLTYKNFEALSLQKILEIQLQQYISTLINNGDNISLYSNYQSSTWYAYKISSSMDYKALIILSHVLLATLFHQLTDLDTSEKIIDSLLSQAELDEKKIDTLLKIMNITLTLPQQRKLKDMTERCIKYGLRDLTADLTNVLQYGRISFCNKLFKDKTEALSFIATVRNYRKEHCTASAEKKLQYDQILEKITALMQIKDDATNRTPS